MKKPPIQQQIFPRPGSLGIARKAAQGRSMINRSLERQADEATNMALHGDVNAGRVLTPTPVAAYTRPESTAELLPGPVRNEAEVAFGADLSAVRIHRDASAWTAARGEGAAAFTAGNHIFFGERQWDPGGAGKRLLYHEIAHVLQQTGRRETPTLIRAQDLRGSGAIQAERPRGGRRG
jgi:hypothetical protein